MGGALVGGLRRAQATLAQAVDVLEHDDRCIDHHADGEGQSGQRDDVDGAAQGRHRDEGADDRHRDRQGDDQGCPTGPQEDQQQQRRQRAANVDVLVHQGDRRVDVDRLVVDLAELQSGVRHLEGTQVGQGRADPLHRLDHVGAGLPRGVHRQGGLSVHADTGRRIGIAEANDCDVVDRYASDPSQAVPFGAQHDIADGLQGVQFAFGPNHIAALALLYVAGRHAGVGGAQACDHLCHGQLIARQQFRFDDDLDLPFAPAEDVDGGNARNSLQTVDQHVVDKISVGMDRPLVAGQSDDVEPGDGVVVASRCVQRRLVDLVGIVGDAVEPVGHQQQSAVHVGGDREFQAHARPARLRTRSDGL